MVSIWNLNSEKIVYIQAEKSKTPIFDYILMIRFCVDGNDGTKGGDKTHLTSGLQWAIPGN